MTTASSLPGDNQQPRDAANWAERVSELQISRVPTGALNLNVEGLQAVGPLQGFGQLWQKTYRVRLPGVKLRPAEVMQVWKENFARFMPSASRFFPVKAVAPGEVIIINDSSLGMPVSTGVVVLYADDESFTVMTPQGHPESGWNTFSTYTEDGSIVCQIQSMARADDPIYELGFRLLGTRAQEKIWTYVLETLAAHFDVNGQVQIVKICVDPRMQWSEAKNIWHNAALRTFLYTLMAPLRWLKRAFSPRQS